MNIFRKDYSFRKFHSIRKIQLNLIDIKIQFIFCNVILSRVFLDQGMNIFFQVYYNELGMDNIFNLWWISFFCENIGNMYKYVHVIYLNICGCVFVPFRSVVLHLPLKKLKISACLLYTGLG